ncbi:flagellar basal-body rod protein FlgF [Sphingomonas sp. OV641]|uniref:flagellar basal body rod protein FlgF n=1 Tax=Sphingomonas sp. OV641 TaxID=1881068 RepID=UPI0008D1E776|nr:flagellar basal body rod protein FlgF [Sphingomonas sp. OV641]SEJ36994.1 flagellar basal-body rod protein FlgF [Sphingomonas sp. OV641]
MDKLVYTAATGLKAHMAAQAAIANNMANASTTGFRADRVVFDRIELKGGGARFDARAPAAQEVTDADRSVGAMIQTGRNLDVALTDSDTWLTVQSPDGTEAYTRRGDLTVTASGTLQTGDGYLVMGSGGPITIPPYSSLSIGSDGSISIVPQGGSATDTTVVDKLKLVSDRGSSTVKGLDNLMHVRGGGVLPENMDAKIASGTLEESNVNMTQVLVDMIENQRSYEVQANLLKEAKTMDEGAASVMRMPG